MCVYIYIYIVQKRRRMKTLLVKVEKYKDSRDKDDGKKLMLKKVRTSKTLMLLVLIDHSVLTILQVAIGH